MRNTLKAEQSLAAVILPACLNSITSLFLMQERKLGYRFVILISIFIVEFEAGSQSIVMYMD